MVVCFCFFGLFCLGEFLRKKDHSACLEYVLAHGFCVDAGWRGGGDRPGARGACRDAYAWSFDIDILGVAKRSASKRLFHSLFVYLANNCFRPFLPRMFFSQSKLLCGI